MAVIPVNKKQGQDYGDPNLHSLNQLIAQLRANGLVTTPVDIKEIAEFLGLEVSYELMEKDISGYLEFKNGSWVVGVNAQQHSSRQRFTIAHEIAHYVLHRNPNEKVVDFTFARRNEEQHPRERQADEFAAQLLMPEDSVRDAIAQGQTSLEQLAQEFEVSGLAMRYRVQSLGYTVK